MFYKSIYWVNRVEKELIPPQKEFEDLKNRTRIVPEIWDILIRRIMEKNVK